MKKLIFISAGIIILGLGAAAVARADSDKPELMVQVNKEGRVLVRGAVITSVATSTISAIQTWPGGGSINWVVQTDGSTEFIRHRGGRAELSEFLKDHVISFEGRLVAGVPLTVQAQVVKNWSVEKETIDVFGIIQSIDATAKSFVLKTDERKLGDVTILVSDATEIIKGNTLSTFSALKVGDRVKVKGLWDKAAKTIQARKIKIHQDDRRVFEEGRLKSFSATSTAPTSIVVTFKKFDYTVNIDTGTAVVNKNWEPAKLSDFQVGDRIRVYGVADGSTIDATVVRNISLPR